MNKVLFIVFLLVAGVSQSMFAQLNFNISSGMNYSNCSFEDAETFAPEWKSDFFVGIAPNYKLSKRIHLQLDCQYSQKGFYVGENLFVPVTFRYGYIDLMPEVEFYIFKNLAFSVGCNYGIKVSEKIKEESKDWEDVKLGNINSTDFGLTSGIKLQFRKVFAFVRYNHGLTSLSEIKFLDPNVNEIIVSQRNRNLQIGVGYRFGFQS